MSDQSANLKMLTKLMFRLLPAQVLLNLVGAVNGLVSSFFASNFVGITAMSAVGLYMPLGTLLTSISTILVGGSAILCGRFIGENEQRKVQGVFSTTLSVSLLVSLVIMAAFVVIGAFDLSGFLTTDAQVRPLFNWYLLGQTIGVIPLMLGNSFAAFLSIENKGRRTFVASISYVVANVVLNFVFVQMMHLEALGLALASALGMWVFLGVQAQVFLSGKSHFKIALGGTDWGEAAEIFRIGLPGAATYLYLTGRGIIVNKLLEVFVGSVGISAFAAANNLLGLVWAIPAGMQAVSRMIISVSIGEEDRQTLTDVMRVMFRRFIPLMLAVVVALISCSVPLTSIFYHDPTEPVFMMTTWGFRILPLCMPLSVVLMHFTSYGQASGKNALLHLQALLDGIVCVAGFTALLIPHIGMNSVYVANVLNGIVTNLVLVGYACLKNGHIPRDMEELMVIPEGFGVSEDERLDFSVRSIGDVIKVSDAVWDFCKRRGISKRSTYLAALSMEEMAGNVVDHGFTKDERSHSVDVRVVHKDDDVILRIKDDCVPFDPHERQSLTEPADPLKNIGIRMVFKMAKDVQYQNILGLNVLTIRIDGNGVGETGSASK